MALYSYNKYTINREPYTSSRIYDQWVVGDGEVKRGDTYYRDYTFNPNNGSYSPVGRGDSWSEPTAWNYSVYVFKDGYMYRVYQVTTSHRHTREAKFGTAGGNRVRGSYVGAVVAEDGTYPNNGISGSYWYIRGAMAKPNPPSNIKVSGEFKGGKALDLNWNPGSYVTNYQIQRQDNGGSWVDLGDTTATSYTDILPRGVETVSYRIRTYGNTQYSSYVATTTYDIKNFPEMGIIVDGKLMTGSQGWVKVNGELKEIAEIHMKVNGQLREG